MEQLQLIFYKNEPFITESVVETREEGRWERTVHALSIRLGFGAALPPLEKLQTPTTPPPPAEGAWDCFSCVLSSCISGRTCWLSYLFLKKNKISAQVEFPDPVHPKLNLANLCSEHRSLTGISKHKFFEVNIKPFFENYNPHPFFFSIVPALIMAILSSMESWSR